MSVSDKIKLDSIQKDAINKETADTFYAPLKHVGAGGAAHALATQITAGFMSPEDKEALQLCNKYISVFDDIAQVYTTAKYVRNNGTLYQQCVLSQAHRDANGNLTRDTRTYYAQNGTTVVKTEVYVITYDSKRNVISEVLQ